MNCNVSGYQNVTFLTPLPHPLTPETFRSPRRDAIVLWALRAGYFSISRLCAYEIRGEFGSFAPSALPLLKCTFKLIRIYTYGIAHTLPRIDAKQGGWVVQEVNVKLTLSVGT